MGQTSSFPRPEVDTYNVCAEISDPNGSLLTQQVGRSLQWFTFVLSWLQLAFYGYQSFRATMGWEETYVCIIEAIKITLDIFYMYASPATIYQTNGNTVNWLTYSEWLLTCPVILVQLCNITGLESDFNDRTMQVLISDVGAIVFGVSSAFSEGPLKMFFFLCGCCYGIFTFYHAAKIYYESYHMVPDGLCRNLVRYMAWCFYISWVGFPIIFLTGADGYGPLTIWAEVALQQIVEVLAKNVWGMLGHILRLKIHEHIIMYGDVRKPNKIKFGGKEVRILSWTDKEDENTIRKSAKHLVGRRSSFLRMRDQMKRRGIPTRGSIDNIQYDGGAEYEDEEARSPTGKKGPPRISTFSTARGSSGASQMEKAAPGLANFQATGPWPAASTPQQQQQQQMMMMMMMASVMQRGHQPAPNGFAPPPAQGGAAFGPPTTNHQQFGAVRPPRPPSPPSPFRLSAPPPLLPIGRRRAAQRGRPPARIRLAPRAPAAAAPIPGPPRPRRRRRRRRGRRAPRGPSCCRRSRRWATACATARSATASTPA
uniref:O protein n=1 Tax=Tetraselmis sp. GSL018 TaxID=582737 RepID=A0A061R245_9CHLO